MRQGLFFKIFTWFWLTVILTSVAIEGTSAYARRGARSVGAKFERLLPDAARVAATTLETRGEAALAAYLSELQQKQSVMAYFFDVRGDERTHRWTSAAIRKEGLLATREPGMQRSGKDGEIAAMHVMGERGNNYAMVLVLPRGASAAAWSLPVYWRLVAIILISGVFCFLVARHVATPVLRLQAAAAGIAAGHLDLRVSAKLQRRGDEIAGLAQDFNRMAARIEALVGEQKALLANVSHELRSPLSRLLVALSLAKRNAAVAPENLERIGEEARRLDTLIEQLLTLSRIESGVNDGHRVQIDLSRLVHEVVSDADFEASARGGRVVVKDDGGGAIVGDENALRSALENIVRNAVRYTAEESEVEVSIRREGGSVVVMVRDHGPGVAEEMLGRIFSPFCGEGTGLGLAIAERAIVAHGGCVSAANAEGGGLLIEVRLPEDGRFAPSFARASRIAHG
jgi:signal transduction histidine kinase